MAGPVIIQSPSFLPAGYKLKWRDGFDVGKFDYSYDRSGVHDWYEGVWWNDNDPVAEVSVTGSVLRLGWRPGMPLEVDISSLLAWRYGYFEATMAWDNRPAVWPAFWMIPQQGATATENGEIDIIEAQYSNPGMIFSTIHDWTGPSLNTDERPLVPNSVTLPAAFQVDAWHKYGVLWTPGNVQFYLDGQPTISAALPPVYDTQDFFMVLSLQIGDQWTKQAPVLSGPLHVYVDEVEVWQDQ